MENTIETKSQDVGYWVAAVVVGVVALMLLFGWYASDFKPIHEAKSAVRERMLDPDSAQFRGVSISITGDACGEVNAKNSFGAYVGFRWFHLTRSGEKWIAFIDDSESHTAEMLCTKTPAG